MASRSRIHHKYRQKRKVENHPDLSQITQNARKSFQNRPKMGPSGPPDPPNSAVRRTTCRREAPRSSKDAYQAPKMPSEAPKMPSEAPKKLPRSPQKAPKSFQETPQKPSKRSKNANNLPRSVKKLSKSFQEAQQTLLAIFPLPPFSSSCFFLKSCIPRPNLSPKPSAQSLDIKTQSPKHKAHKPNTIVFL